MRLVVARDRHGTAPRAWTRVIGGDLQPVWRRTAGLKAAHRRQAPRRPAALESPGRQAGSGGAESGRNERQFCCRHDHPRFLCFDPLSDNMSEMPNRVATKLLLAGVALGGVAAGHVLAYLLAVPSPAARHALLVETGHGYWPVAAVSALAASLYAAGSVALCHARTGAEGRICR